MILQCRHLCKKYGRKTVADKISFSVEKGEIFALLGANGAGKTTTIKMILNLTKPSSGTIQIKENIKIGYSPESPCFPMFLTGREVLEYYACIEGIKKKEAKKLAGRLLINVGLDDDKIRVKKYSKGMMQRLSLAQSLIGSPDLLILDEPTSGLDALGRIEMLKIISRFKDANVTVVLNSHVLSDVEKICDRGIVLKKGCQTACWERGMSDSLEQFFVDCLSEE